MPYLHHSPLCRYFPTILIVLLAVFNDGAMIALSKDRVSTLKHGARAADSNTVPTLLTVSSLAHTMLSRHLLSR